MDVVVSGRHCTVTEDFRTLVQEKVAKLERLRDRVIRVEVEVSADKSKNPDQGASVQITLHSRGPVVRAEASASDKAAAFEHALDRLKTQLRRAGDRRREHRGRTRPLREVSFLMPIEESAAEESDVHTVAGIQVEGDGPLVVREKVHAGHPMTLEQALDEMELVGHDFFLYVDAGSGRPSVVYRRRAYDYGVIHLEVPEAAAASA